MKNKENKIKEAPLVEDDKSVVAVQMPLVKYSVTDASLKVLAGKYSVVPDATTPEGMEAIK